MIYLKFIFIMVGELKDNIIEKIIKLSDIED